MKQGGALKASVGGFTIVETLIVLAVTSALFVSAAVIINGRQNKTEFMVAMNEARQQLEQTSNEVSSGYFPSTADFTCKGDPPNSPQITLTTSTGQGTNDLNVSGSAGGCIFMGKVLYMGLPNTDGVYSDYAAYTIAGNRLNSAGDDVTTLYGGTYGGAQPIVAAPTRNSQYYSLHNGLTPVSMKYYDSAGVARDTSGIGYLSTLGSPGVDTGTLASGSQNVYLYAIANTVLADPGLGDGSDTDHAVALNAAAVTVDIPNAIVGAAKVTICLKSGGTNQSGLLTVGGDANQVGVGLTIYASGDCT